MGQEDDADGRRLVERLISAAGVPVLVLPLAHVGEVGRTVLIGWDGSREATRAVHGALPFLRSATKVILCSIGEQMEASLGDAALMLRRHDVVAHVEPAQGAHNDAGNILLARAEAHHADLLVMGAYSHMRLQEFIFGGATRQVIRAATLPILFAG